MGKKVNIGQKYYIEIGNDLKDIPCPWVLNPQSKLHPKYVKWSDLNGEEVIVRSFTKLVTNYANVILAKGPKEAFTIPIKCLLPITYRLPVVCVCESYWLARRGCTCGAFKREKLNKVKT